MPVDFSILQRAPTIGQGILAGQQRARERVIQNRLLARQDLQFQQQQEDRARALEAERAGTARRQQLAQLLQQSNMDPTDLKSAQQFYSVALQTNEPNAIKAAQDWVKMAFEAQQKRQQTEATRAEMASIFGPQAGAAPAAAAPGMGMPPVTSTLIDEGAARPEARVPMSIEGGAQAMPVQPQGAVTTRDISTGNALAPAAPAAAPQNRLVTREQVQRGLMSTNPEIRTAAAAMARTLPPEPKEYAPTELERLNALVANLPPGSPERKVYEARIAKLTAESKGVTVNLPKQQSAFESELGKGQAEKVLKDRAAAEEAVSIIDTVRRGRELLSGPIITGFGAEFLTNFGSALNQIGFSVAKDAVANTQAFAANMAQNVGKIIKQFGAGTGLSNEDRNYAEKMAGGKITLDKEALEKILEINERAARNVIQAHNKRVANIKTNIPLTVEMPPAPTARGRVGGEAAASISDERANAQAAIAAGAPEAAVRKRFKEKTGQEL